METFLTPDEVKTLTGYTHKDKQIEWLKKQHLPFWANAAGNPVVPRQAICGGDDTPKHSEQWQPHHGS